MHRQLSALDLAAALGAGPAKCPWFRRHPPPKPHTSRAIDAAGRHNLPLPRLRPRHISDVQQAGDLIVAVCDLAYEELDGLAVVHWSVPDPVQAGDPQASTRR